MISLQFQSEHTKPNIDMAAKTTCVGLGESTPDAKLYCGQTVQDRPCRIGMWGQYFDWYHFRPPYVLHNPQIGGGELGGYKLALELRPNGGR